MNNPIATVQLIPIYSYLNILSDFLFLQNYLTEDDQTKQIPIINALYQYLEDEHDVLSKKEVLIQKLLEGSDLYGGKEGELYDTTFANSMFDYIISSVVFGKYGNIFGFLANVVRDVDNLQIDHVLEKMKEALNGIYENNCGEGSTLSHLAMSRIYHDIILPMFPRSKNMSLLSFDYMFAQAGAMYLRTGRLSDTYNLHSAEGEAENSEETMKNSDETIFNEYIIVGHTVYSLLRKQKMDSLSYRAFALPVLFYYVNTEKAVKNQIITNIIFRPEEWAKAYRTFHNYVEKIFENIEDQLKKDHIFRIHKTLSEFQNHAMIANFVLNDRCAFIHDHVRKTRIPVYLEFADHFECRSGEALPNIDEWFKDKIHSFGEIYEDYDLEATQQQFNETFKEPFGMVIKLIVPNHEVFTDVNEGKLHPPKLPFDFLEVYKNNNTDYYVLKRENYTVSLVKESDDPQTFQKIIGQHLEPLTRLGDRIILKFTNESIHEFSQELMKYKKDRLKTYLNYPDDDPRKEEWWKEFGLSLVASYPCISNNKDYQVDDEYKFCEQDIIKFLNKFPEDVSSYITNANTRSLFSQIGTTARTIFIKHRIDKVINKSVMQNAKYDDLDEELSLYLEDPSFETKSITYNGILYIRTIFYDLKRNINYNFTFVEQMLHEMERLLNFSFTKHIRDVGEEQLLVNSLDDITGFGYKFINIPNSNSHAELRTVYDSKDEIFLSLCQNSTRNQKIYIKVNDNLDFEANYFVYESKDQLRRKRIEFPFSGISMHHDNETCNNYTYLVSVRNTNVCLRYWRYIEKINYERDAVHLLKNMAVIAGRNSLTSKQILDTLRRYVTTYDNASLSYFVGNWLNKDFEDLSKGKAINNPELLNKLRYDLSWDNRVDIYDGESRIDSLYTHRERSEIEKEASMEDIIKDFNSQKARFAVTFEDYYAIRNFASNGEKKITSDKNEAKRMKLALYKLAIRQFDDIDQEFDSKLFRLESKSINYTNSEFRVGKEITFQKFTSTFVSLSSALRLSGYSAAGFRNVLYEMDIIGPYMRAKFEQLEDSPKMQVILLPGMQFHITEVTEMYNIRGIGDALKVVLNAKFSSNRKYESFKNVMREIAKIKL